MISSLENDTEFNLSGLSNDAFKVFNPRVKKNDNDERIHSLLSDDPVRFCPVSFYNKRSIFFA